MSSTLTTVTQTVASMTTTVTASASSTPKQVCYNRWFHPQSCVWNKIEMGFAFAGLGCLALSAILYLIVGCGECFSSRKKDKQKESVIEGDEESKLHSDFDGARPRSSGDLETPRMSIASQETLVPPVRPSSDYSNPFDDPSPHNEHTSSYNPTYQTSSASYPTPFPTPSVSGGNANVPPQWSEGLEDVTEKQYLIPRPAQAATKPGFRESY